MKRIRVIGVCLVAVVAITAFAATTASASPEFFSKGVVGATVPAVKYTGAITTATLEPFPSKDKVVCNKGVASGEVTGATSAVENFITFTECAGASTKCKSEGQPNGTIQVGPLVGTLGALSPTKPGIELEELGGGKITEINCGGVLEVTVEGKIFGDITGDSTVSVAASKLPTSLSMVFKEKSGVQEFLKFEGEAGSHQLEGLVNGKHEIQGQTATAKLVSSPVDNLGVTE